MLFVSNLPKEEQSTICIIWSDLPRAREDCEDDAEKMLEDGDWPGIDSTEDQSDHHQHDGQLTGNKGNQYLENY